MPGLASLTVRVDEDTRRNLEQISKQTDRSMPDLTKEALEQYVETQRWQYQRIKDALAGANAGGPFVAHEDVKKWVDSWGTDNELPEPEPTIYKPPVA